MYCAVNDMLVGGQSKRCTGEETSHQTNTHPSCHAPAKAGEKGSETATDEEGGHEDGVHPVGGFRQLSQAAALVGYL